MDKKEVTLDFLTEEDKMKYQIAAEIGLLEKVKECGWKGLTSKESGKIGGIMAGRKKNKPKE